MLINIIRNFNRKEEEVKVGAHLGFRSSTPMTITPNYTNNGITLQYSLDTITWTNIAAKEVTPSSEVIYFRGSATGTKSLFTSSSYGNAWTFTGATNLEVIGNINMLIQDTLGGMVSDVALSDYAFAYMFYNCAALLKASELPATTLAPSCYNSMFSNCTSLTVAPILPATTLAASCYGSMFRGCTSLTAAPQLPVTTLATSCYSYMFYGCASLTVAPELPATTLANNCYQNMFYGCTSLTVAPELPATKLNPNCYNSMFSNCTRLKFSLVKDGEYQKEYGIPKIGTIPFAPTGWGTNMFSGTGGTFTGTPYINTTYYVPNEHFQYML